MTYKTIKYSTNNGVGRVTLSRPDNMNAFNGDMMQDLMSVMDEIDNDDSVRSVIFTGDGRAFCAGADLEKGGDTFNADEAGELGPDSKSTSGVPRDVGGVLTLRYMNCKKPLIAAINGPAVGVGATMTLPMDIRLASTKSKMGFVFARRGIVVDGAASWFLPRIVGLPQALEWTLTGRVFDAREALAGGLVRSLHEPGELLDAAEELAREIADNCSPVSVAYCRQLLWRTSGEPHPMLAHRIESEGLLYAGRSPDAIEGVMSFLEKRAASFPSKVSSDMPANFPWWDEPDYDSL